MTECRTVTLMRLAAQRPTVDQDRLTEEMNRQRHTLGLTIRQIAAAMGVRMTEAEHWFRTDRYRSLPRPELWTALRDLLGMEGWDEVSQVTYTDYSYDMLGRAYRVDGTAPTVLGRSVLICWDRTDRVPGLL